MNNTDANSFQLLGFYCSSFVKCILLARLKYISRILFLCVSGLGSQKSFPLWNLEERHEAAAIWWSFIIPFAYLTGLRQIWVDTAPYFSDFLIGLHSQSCASTLASEGHSDHHGHYQ